MKKILLKFALFMIAFFGLQQTVSALSFGWGGGHRGRRGYHRRRGYGGFGISVGRPYARTVVIDRNDDDDDEEIDDLERENRRLRRRVSDLEERIEDLETK